MSKNNDSYTGQLKTALASKKVQSALPPIMAEVLNELGIETFASLLCDPTVMKEARQLHAEYSNALGDDYMFELFGGEDITKLAADGAVTTTQHPRGATKVVTVVDKKTNKTYVIYQMQRGNWFNQTTNRVVRRDTMSRILTGISPRYQVQNVERIGPRRPAIQQTFTDGDRPTKPSPRKPKAPGTELVPTDPVVEGIPITDVIPSRRRKQIAPEVLEGEIVNEPTRSPATLLTQEHPILDGEIVDKAKQLAYNAPKLLEYTRALGLPAPDEMKSLPEPQRRLLINRAKDIAKRKTKWWRVIIAALLIFFGSASNVQDNQAKPVNPEIKPLENGSTPVQNKPFAPQKISRPDHTYMEGAGWVPKSKPFNG